MSQYTINIGALPNDGTGDPLRTAFNETNLNFDQVFAAGPVLSNIQIANNTILTTNTNGNLVLAPNGTAVVQSNVSIVPNLANIRNLGSSTQRWNTVYTQYLNATQINLTGDLTVGGNLTVTGNIIQIGNIVTDSLTIQLANTATTSNAANGAGITVGANDNIATILYNSSGNVWSTNIGISSVGNITAPYFIGNGSQLTGLAPTYSNANVATFMADFGSNTVSTTGNVTSGYLFGTGNATISGIANTKTHVQVNTFGAGLTNSESGGQFIGSYTRTGSSVAQGDGLAGLYGYGSADGTTLLANAAAFIELQAATTWSNTSAPSHISFFVCDGSGIIANRAVQINANGNLQIYNGDLSVANGNILAGGLSVTGNIEGNVVAPDGNGSIVVNASGILGAVAGLNYTANTLFAPSMSPQGTANIGTNSLFVGLPAFVPLGSNVIVQVTSNVNDYSQINQQNISSGNTASGDYIITANNGNDTTNFIDLGITGSSWDGTQTNSLGNILGPNDGYLYTQDGNLVIGTSGNTINAWKFEVDGNVTAGGNLVPATSNVYSLGNATNQWSDLYVSNATIYMNNIPIELTAGNVLTVDGNDVVTTNTDGQTNIGNLGIGGTTIYIADGAEETVINISPSIESQAFIQVPKNSVANVANVRIHNDAGNIEFGTSNSLMYFDNTGNLTVPGNILTTGNVSAGNILGNGAGLTSVVTKASGTWTVTSGTNNYSFTVPVNGVYQLWVNGNIPNGIIAYNATVSVTNSNVPVIGQQFAWNYEGAGNPITFTSIPAQIIGTAGAISNANPSVGTTTNTFEFSINNSSGGNVTVTWGYAKIS